MAMRRASDTPYSGDANVIAAAAAARSGHIRALMMSVREEGDLSRLDTEAFTREARRCAALADALFVGGQSASAGRARALAGAVAALERALSEALE